MPLLVIEPRQSAQIPGTVLLKKLQHGEPEAGVTTSASQLKYDTSGTIILNPQPSADQNDPLNWPRWRKEMFIVASVWGVACVGAIGPLLGPAYVQLAAEWGVTLAHFSSGTNGALIVCLAGATPITNLIAIRYGKRPVYLVSGVGLVATAFWGSAAKSFGSFVASRAFSGVCMAAMEALIPASIADVWFVHERGLRIAFFNLAFLAGVSIGPLIAGQLIQNYSWRVCSYAMAGALVLSLMLVVFFMPETAYRRTRSGRVNIAVPSQGSAAHSTEPHGVKDAHEMWEEQQAERTESLGNTEVQGAVAQRKTYVQSLEFWSGYRSEQPIVQTLLSPVKMLRSPMVLWASVVYMTAITWIVIITIGASQIFAGPPYNFSIAAVGNTFLSPFIASVLGTIAASPLIDGGVKFLSKRNKGVFEAEFRLPVIATYLLFTATGFFSAGEALGRGLPWELPVILSIAFINFGIILSVTVAIAYVVDCHHEQAVEAVSAMVFLKNMFAFGSTYYINDWIAGQGARAVFFTLGGISAGITLSGIPMYIFGKQIRALVARHAWCSQRG